MASDAQGILQSIFDETNSALRVTGGGLLTVYTFNPATLASATRTGATTFVDATFNDGGSTVPQVTFTTPVGGKVLVRISTIAVSSSAGHFVWLCLRESSSDVTGTATMINPSTSAIRCTAEIYVTGLTAGSSHTYKLGMAIGNSAQTATLRAGDNDAADNTGAGPLVMTVWEAP